MSRFNKPRSFRRDESLSIRIPADKKDRLKRIAGVKQRDTSNLALEFITNGITHEESQIANGVQHEQNQRRHVSA